MIAVINLLLLLITLYLTISIWFLITTKKLNFKVINRGFIYNS